VCHLSSQLPSLSGFYTLYCYRCSRQSRLNMSTNRTRRIQKEITDIHADSISNISAAPLGNGEDLTHLKGSFKGPPGTPYEGGTYTIDVRIPGEYPFRPPIMRFDTKVWHPNVSSQTVSVRSTILVCDQESNTRMALGRHLPRHPLYCLVSCSHDQICPPLPPIATQHAGAQGPPRCRGGRHADAKPQGV
jgi:hypothetical protein